MENKTKINLLILMVVVLLVHSVYLEIALHYDNFDLIRVSENNLNEINKLKDIFISEHLEYCDDLGGYLSWDLELNFYECQPTMLDTSGLEKQEIIDWYEGKFGCNITKIEQVCFI